MGFRWGLRMRAVLMCSYLFIVTLSYSQRRLSLGRISLLRDKGASLECKVKDSGVRYTYISASSNPRRQSGIRYC